MHYPQGVSDPVVDLRHGADLMSGACMALPFSASFGTLSTTLTSGRKSDGATYWDTGFVGTGSAEAVAAGGTFGSLASAAYGSTTAVAVFWQSGTSYADTGGQVAVQIAGNYPGGTVSSLVVDGTGMGSVSSRSYDSGSNSTTFFFLPLRANPFGASSSTHSIVLS